MLNGKRILAVYEDNTGDIWVGGELGGLYRYNRKTGKSSFYQIKGGNFTDWIENYIWDIFQDSKGNFWIGTSSSGFFYFSKESGERVHFHPNDFRGEGMTDFGAWEAFSSRDGVFWIGGNQGNIYRFNLFQNKIPNFTTPSRANHFYEAPKGDFWIATSEHKILVEEKFDDTTRHVEIDITPYNDEDDYVTRIFEDSQGNI